MTPRRLESFSSTFVAVVIVIMVLALDAPQEATWDALRDLGPMILAYLLSFVTLAIYWKKHRDMLRRVGRYSNSIVWANLHVLFWLSLLPFSTGWMGESGFAVASVAVYGITWLGACSAYYILQRMIVRQLGKNARVTPASTGDVKPN